MEKRAMFLIKEAREKENKKLEFSKNDKLMLGEVGMRAAQDKADGKPGDGRLGAIGTGVGAGALIFGTPGAIIGSAPKYQEITTTRKLHGGAKVTSTNRVRTGGGLKGAAKGLAIGGGLGGLAFGSLGNASYNYGEDYQKEKMNK